MKEFNLDISQEDAKSILEISKKYERLMVPIKSEESTGRHQYNRDFSRILYSSSYRRLQGKMQFLSITSSRFYRNRLTHSHEVSQIARSIAAAVKRTLKEHNVDGFSLFDKGMYVIEAVSLAHDIGNPPFGHAGESVLNTLMKDKGGYEGNAQTFRVLNKLERRFPNDLGLNLSKRTLLGVIKYVNKADSERKVKKFLYDEDFVLAMDISRETDVKLRTLDAQIMDVADEIAYAAHDLEDALKEKVFTIDELLFEFEKDDKYKDQFKKLEEIVNKSKMSARTSTSRSSEDYLYFFSKMQMKNKNTCL